MTTTDNALPKNLLVMYHSVASSQHPNVLGSFPISMERFIYQIQVALEQGYQIARLTDIHTNKNKDNKYLYITGDDGTVDWGRNVLPWCEANQFYTHTGLITGIWHDTPIFPLTHIIQIILIIRDAAALQQLSDNLQQNYLTNEQLAYINRVYHYETAEYRRIIKGAFNLILEADVAYSLIDDLSATEYDWLTQRFEDADYYKQFNYADVGVHTVTHTALGLDTATYVANEIEQSEQDLLNVGLTPSGFFTSPMTPRHGATLHDLMPHLRAKGYAGILDHGDVWDQQSYIIKRIDAKRLESVLGVPEFKE